MSTDLMKFIAAIVMYVAWGALAFLGKTDIGPFVGFTMAALGAILGHSSATVSRTVPAAVDVKQAGFARLRFLITLASIAIGLSLLSGCASLTEAGNTAYTVEPVADQDGKLVCCRFSAHDGKEFSARTITFQKNDNGGVALQVQEGASSAFQGQAIAEKGLSVLPSFAPMLLPQGPATVIPQLAAPAAPAASGAK